MTITRFVSAILLLTVSVHAYLPSATLRLKRSPGLGLFATTQVKEPARLTRSAFLTTILTVSSSLPANGFRGGSGAGGLGKTKPETGVVFLNEESTPTQQRNGDVSAELLVDNGKTPVLVLFNSPWPLLETTTDGIQTRNPQDPESAFVQVADTPSGTYTKQFFVDTIFGSQGKYGAYGAPSDISVKPIEEGLLYQVKFTSLTPAMRQSDREVYIGTRRVGSSTVMLVTGSTAARFAKMDDRMRRVAESFQVIPAPSSSLNKASV
jgi:hypothetical protein|mmetsp:Transcript_899/g.1676  ORF Transcript_899/g.1676 Transcript_899/m.1676 type:complete len:265 (-) Transcript_899:128-922(-)